jgi:hypothetical protein
MKIYLILLFLSFFFLLHLSFLLLLHHLHYY